jgi:hypothetical protein
MLQYSNPSNFYDGVIRLTEEAKSNPLKVLIEFTEDYTLSELREFLSDIGEVCITSDIPPFDCGRNRADLLLHNNRLEELYEAVFLLVGQKISITDNPAP